MEEVTVRPGVCRNLDLINHSSPEMFRQDITSCGSRQAQGSCSRDKVDVDSSSLCLDYSEDLCLSDVVDLCATCVVRRSGNSQKRLNTHDSGFFSDASMECDSDSSVCHSDTSTQRITSNSNSSSGYHSHAHERTYTRTEELARGRACETRDAIKVDGRVDIERTHRSRYTHEHTHGHTHEQTHTINFVKRVHWLDRNYGYSHEDNVCYGATGITRYHGVENEDDDDDDDDDVFVDDEEHFLSNFAQISGNTTNKTSTPTRAHKSRGHRHYDDVTNDASLLSRCDVCQCVTCSHSRLVTRSTATQTTSGRRTPKARVRKSINKELASMFDVYTLESIANRAENNRPTYEAPFLPLLPNTLPDVIPVQCPDEVQIGRELRNISDEFDARMRKRRRHSRQRDDDRAHRKHSLDFLYDSLFVTLVDSWFRGILTNSWNR